MDQSIFYDREYKIAGLTFGGGKELVICNFGRMEGLCLGSNHIFGVVWNILVVNGRLGARGKLGAIAHLVVVLVHEEAHQVVYFLLHILQEREDYLCDLFADLHEVSVSWLPQNGVKYVELCCK